MFSDVIRYLIQVQTPDSHLDEGLVVWLFNRGLKDFEISSQLSHRGFGRDRLLLERDGVFDVSDAEVAACESVKISGVVRCQSAS